MDGGLFLHYYSSTECHLAVLFKLTWSLLRKKGLDEHLQGCVAEFVEHLMHKINSFSVGASPLEMLREQTYPVIWEQFDLVGLEEVDRVLEAVSAITCLLDPYLTWLVKAFRSVTCKWIQARRCSRYYLRIP